MDSHITKNSHISQKLEYFHQPNSKKCRLCLASLDTLIEIFSEGAVDMKINEKLKEFCHLAITEEDPAPKTICFTCLNEVNRFSDFYKRIQENQKLLTLSFQPSIIHEAAKFAGLAQDMNENDESQEPLIIAIAEEICEADDVQENVEILYESAEANGDDHDDSELVQCEIVLQKSSEETKSKSYPLTDRNEAAPTNDSDVEHHELDTTLYAEDQHDLSESDHDDRALSPPTAFSEESTKSRAKHRIALDKPIRDFFDLHCEKCNMNFQTFQGIRNHMLQKHDEQFYFVCCNRKLYRRDAVMAHISSHLNPQKFTCEVCNQVCKSKITLKVHMKQHIPKDQQPFACEKCGFRFALKSQLKSHMNTHLTNEEKRFVCNECGKPFAFKFVLEKHKKRIHIKQKNYMCEICARSFVDEVNLTAHKRIHDTTTPRLECPKCHALLKTKKTLKIHMLVHNPSQFSCESCAKDFPTKNGLLNHIRYYHTDRKYPCETCGRVFKKSLNLKEHMATHTGEILYNCEYCDKTFNAKANRYAHIKKVHPNEWANKRKLRWRIEDEKYSE